MANPFSTMWSGAQQLLGRSLTSQTSQPLRGPDGRALQPVTQGSPTATGLPHVYTFSSLLNVASKTYSMRWDEAYGRHREDALAMRRDCGLMALLRERQYPTEQMSWHLEPENKMDPAQVLVTDQLTQAVKSVPKFRRLLRGCLEAIWYGRAGVQYDWGQKAVNGRPWRLPLNHFPVNGDKIQYRWDGTPLVQIYGGEAEALKNQGAEIEYATDFGRAIVLSTPEWRQRFCIHKHDCIDADFWESEMAGGVHGVGVRHWVYWHWWLKNEFEAWMTNYIERVGLGLTIYYYEAGNERSEDQAAAAAKKKSSNTVIVWPRSTTGANVGSGIDRMEVPVGGVEFIRNMMEYFDDRIERFIVGQSMSGGDDTTGSLGGTGRAKFAQETKQKIIKDDAEALAETLTEDLVKPIMRLNTPRAPFRVRFVFDVDKPDPSEWLEGAKAFVEMGGEIVEDEARAVLGFRKPQPGEKTLKQAAPAPSPFGMPGVPGDNPGGPQHPPGPTGGGPTVGPPRPGGPPPSTTKNSSGNRDSPIG